MLHLPPLWRRVEKRRTRDAKLAVKLVLAFIPAVTRVRPSGDDLTGIPASVIIDAMPESIEHVDHVNLVVDDLSAMTAFYREVLGLRVTKQVTISGDWIQATTGLENVLAEVNYLEPESGPGLELTRYRSPEGPRPPGLGVANTKGIRHVAFRVRDLEAVVGRLKAAGVDLLSDVQSVPTAQVEFADRQKRIVYCRDPEGNLLEFCDFR